MSRRIGEMWPAHAQQCKRNLSVVEAAICVA
jgi:hypothetical protein